MYSVVLVISPLPFVDAPQDLIKKVFVARNCMVRADRNDKPEWDIRVGGNKEGHWRGGGC